MSKSDVFARAAFSGVDLWISSYEARRRRAMSAWAETGAGGSLREVLDRLAHELAVAVRQRDAFLAGGLAARPRRHMPRLVRIARYHNLPERPACIKCGWEPGAASWGDPRPQLERAHIIDRVFGGLDLASNLLPLCSICHKYQPIFKPGDEVAAGEWFGRPARAVPWRVR